MPERIILGIDPGTNVMGYAVLQVEDRKPSLVVMGVLTLSKIENHYVRLRRIHERALISNRSDDTEEVIRHRLEEYEAKTRPVLDYYKVSGRLISIDGSGEISETNSRLCKVLDALLKR